jgi:hypothetical protein
VIVAVALAPGVIGVLGVFCPVLRQVIRIENEGFAFGVKGAPEGLLCLALPIGIVNINNVQIAGSNNVSNFAASRKQLFLPVDSSRLLFQLRAQIFDCLFL